MTIATTDQGPLPETFDELNALLPLRPIRDDVDYENAIEIVDRLAVLGQPNQDQADYLETLTSLVGKYEDEHFDRDFSDITPLDALRNLCDDHGINSSALGELLGNRSLGSKILRGQRQLSKDHIRKLCSRFAVSADLFL